MSHTDDSTRCHHTDAAGRRCRMPRRNAHVTLCGTHLLAQQRHMRSHPAAPVHDLLSGINDLGSASAVKHMLANLTILLTDGRIDLRKALLLAYLSQLLLQSITMANREHGSEQPASRPLLRHVLPAQDPADPCADQTESSSPASALSPCLPRNQVSRASPLSLVEE